MGIRETLNENRGASIGATIGIIVLAVAFIIWSFSDTSSDRVPTSGSNLFFSDDDGKTYFADSNTHVPPFDRNGKQAVGAQVYQTADGKTKFVGYLYRYTVEGKKKLDATRNSPADIFSRIESMEVKRPGTGDTGWVKSSSTAAMEIQSVKAPAGSTGDPEPILAE